MSSTQPPPRPRPTEEQLRLYRSTLARRFMLTPSPHGDRLSQPLGVRLPLTTSIAFFCGAILGLSHGATETGLRFRAENAHRFPTTQAGWYLYHKSKNYRMALGALREAWKMGLRTGVWVGVFVAMEEFVDRGRAGVVAAGRRVRGAGEGDFEAIVAAQRDFASSVLAGMGTAGLFGVWSRMPVATMARMARMGAKVGLGFGVVQDVVNFARGRRVGYVEVLRRRVVGAREEEEEVVVGREEGQERKMGSGG